MGYKEGRGKIAKSFLFMDLEPYREDIRDL